MRKKVIARSEVILIGVTESMKGLMGMLFYLSGNTPEISRWSDAAWPWICAVKIVLGAGLIAGKEWARKALLVFLFFLLCWISWLFINFDLHDRFRTDLIIGFLLGTVFMLYLSKEHVKETLR